MFNIISKEFAEFLLWADLTMYIDMDRPNEEMDFLKTMFMGNEL